MKPLIPLIALLGSLPAPAPAYADDTVMSSTSDYGVIELRRYIVKDGRSQEFATLFDALFPEAFQQLGALALGHFTEPGLPWIGVADSMARVDQLRPLAEAAAVKFSTDGLLRAKATLLVLQPTPRSRLRWLPGQANGAAP